MMEASLGSLPKTHHANALTCQNNSDYLKRGRLMEEMEKKTISNETAHEIIVAVMERQVKRLFILCIILFIALVGTNAYWIWNENQYVDEVTVTQETPSGNNNYVGRDGYITNGQTNDN